MTTIRTVLNAKLNDDIYMRAPPGYLNEEDEGKVLKLLHSLYGLKQAGFEWSEECYHHFRRRHGRHIETPGS